MNSEVINIIDSLEREKGINKELLFEAIEAALISAAKKLLGHEKEDITATMDRETGQMKIFCEGKAVDSSKFGRISAQTAKQVIIQKIREAERSVIFTEYTERVNTIVAGAVHRFDKGNIIVDFGKAEGILPRTEQIQKERYKQGERIRAYIIEVNETSHGPQIVLSRRVPEFIIKLFELEVPEILDGIVEIRAISREPGERTKMAVYSKEEKVDAVGSCVGMRGARVKDIVRELRGERIDIIRWSDDLEIYLKNIFSPIELKSYTLDRENKKMQVIVDDDMLSIGIGKHGQNIRLISKILGWEVDIRGAQQLAKQALGDVADDNNAETPSDEGSTDDGNKKMLLEETEGTEKDSKKTDDVKEEASLQEDVSGEQEAAEEVDEEADADSDNKNEEPLEEESKDDTETDKE